MKRVPATGGIRVGIALLIALVISLGILAVFQPGHCRLLSIPLSDSQETVTDLSYVFPDPRFAHVRNASLLAEYLAGRLNLTHSIALLPIEESVLNPSRLQLLDREATSLDPKPYLFSIEKNVTLHYKTLSYACNEANITLLYDNLEDEDNEFRAFSISFDDYILTGDSPDEYLLTALDVVSWLGYPSENLEVAIYDVRAYSIIPIDDAGLGDWENQSTTQYRNETVIIMQESYSDLEIGGCNQIGFSFDSDDYRLLKLQCAVYVTLPESLGLSATDALLEGGSRVMEFAYNSSSDLLVHEEIAGVRLFPTIQSDYSSTSGERKLGFAYHYRGNMKAGDTSGYTINIIIDSESGCVLSVLRGYIWESQSRDSFFVLPLDSSALILLTASAILLISIVLGPAEFSLPFFMYLIVPFILRIYRTNVLDNFHRGRIYGYITMKPGCSFSEVRTELNMCNGSLAYHLGILEKLGLIQSFKQGNARRFSLSGARRRRPGRLFNKTETSILSTLKENGNTHTSELAAILEISRQRVHYNMKKLARSGITESGPEGWRIVDIPAEASDEES